MRKRVVFLDIDGTLIDSKNAGRAAFIRALHSAFGWTDDIDYIKFSGATDLDVLKKIFTRYQRKLSERDIELFFDMLPRELRRTCADNPPITLPGVREMLDELAMREDTLVGLVTGNIESCARIKLAAAGIDHHFPLGAFGHEHADRNEIARLALARAEGMLAPNESLGQVFIIGDSPADVAAAHAIGAFAVAVATGHPSAEELAAAGADLLVEDLGGIAEKLLSLGETDGRPC